MCIRDRDKIGDIMKNEEAGNVLMQFMQATVKMKLKKSMLGMVKDMTLEGMAGMASRFSPSCSASGTLRCV